MAVLIESVFWGMCTCCYILYSGLLPTWLIRSGSCCVSHVCQWSRIIYPSDLAAYTNYRYTGYPIHNFVQSRSTNYSVKQGREGIQVYLYGHCQCKGKLQSHCIQMNLDNKLWSCYGNDTSCTYNTPIWEKACVMWGQAINMTVYGDAKVLLQVNVYKHSSV